MGLNIVAAGGAAVRGYVRLYLSRLGHRVRAAVTEVELVETCRIDPPDAVVCDSQLPDADGVATAVALGEQRIPVVIVTRWRDRKRVRVLGLPFLQLPLTPLALIVALTGAIPPDAELAVPAST